MKQSISRRWINMVIIAAMLISLLPTGLLAQVAAADRQLNRQERG